MSGTEVYHQEPCGSGWMPIGGVVNKDGSANPRLDKAANPNWKRICDTIPGYAEWEKDHYQRLAGDIITLQDNDEKCDAKLSSFVLTSRRKKAKHVHSFIHFCVASGSLDNNACITAASSTRKINTRCGDIHMNATKKKH